MISRPSFTKLEFQDKDEPCHTRTWKKNCENLTLKLKSACSAACYPLTPQTTNQSNRQTDRQNKQKIQYYFYHLNIESGGFPYDSNKVFEAKPSGRRKGESGKGKSREKQ